LTLTLTFEAFPKVPRLSRECVITEKLDGTNSQVIVLTEQPCNVAFFPVTYQSTAYYLVAGSRNRFLDTSKSGDNYGFAKWVEANCDELVKLGPGRHFGEWWGQGIQRNYGLSEKRFSLFNVGRWWKPDTEENYGGKENAEYVKDRVKLHTGKEAVPSCCDVVPILNAGVFQHELVEVAMMDLEMKGSRAAPGFMNPEGIMVYHTAADQIFKKTFEDDEKGKGN
jgi:hypothetical protein